MTETRDLEGFSASYKVEGHEAEAGVCDYSGTT